MRSEASEKMQILKMLEEGKITATEAARLLEAVGDGSPNGKTTHKPQSEKSGYGSASVHGNSPGSSYSNTTDYSNNNTNNYSNNNFDDSSNSFEKKDYSGYSAKYNNNRGKSNNSSSSDGFAENLGRKFDTFTRDLEPKLQKFTEKVAERTVGVVDMISKSITQDFSSRPRERHPMPDSSVTGRGKFERTLELKVSPGDNELIISGLKAPILLTGYNGDKLSATLLCIPKRNDARIEFTVLGGKYFLDYNEDDFEKVGIDAFIPENMFKNVNISNYGGDLTLSTLTADIINIQTSNAKTEILNIHARDLTAECESGKDMRIENVYCKNAQFNNYNGSIYASYFDIENLKMTSFDGTFNISVSEFKDYSNYYWSLETSNQRLSILLPSLSYAGYYIKAKASLGDVRVGLAGMDYITKSQSYAEVKSQRFDTLPTKVRMSLETSNAALVVN